jgi:hypothetical protein
MMVDIAVFLVKTHVTHSVVNQSARKDLENLYYALAA